MKSIVELRKDLGITQTDMPEYLGVSRSYYTMHESGKRTLPHNALKLAANLLGEMAAVIAKQKRQKNTEIKQLQADRLRYVKRLKLENEYQILLVSKKIQSLRKKEKSTVTKSMLINSLRIDLNKGERRNENAASLLLKVSRSYALPFMEELFALEIRQEVLQFERLLLDSKL